VIEAAPSTEITVPAPDHNPPTAAALMRALEVTLTRGYYQQPPVVIETLLGAGAEFTPARLRGLALALLRAADDAEPRPPARTPCLPATRTYPIDPIDTLGKDCLSPKLGL
jgi:hypothetical protein